MSHGMLRVWRSLCLFGLLIGFYPPALLGQGADSPRPAPADVEELREVFQEYRIQTTPEKPSAMIYLRDVTYAVLEAFIDRLGTGLVGLVATVAAVGAQTLLLLTLVLLIAVLVRALYLHYQRRRAGTGIESPVTASRSRTGEEPEGRDDVEWTEELRRRLAAGEVAPACEALWWWLAVTLVPERVERSWTSRELLKRAGRIDLRAPAARLDRMIYGAESPEMEDVQRLWDDLDQAASSQEPAGR